MVDHQHSHSHQQESCSEKDWPYDHTVSSGWFKSLVGVQSRTLKILFQQPITGIIGIHVNGSASYRQVPVNSTRLCNPTKIMAAFRSKGEWYS